MSVTRLESLAQIALARKLWKPSPKFWKLKGMPYYNQLERLEKKAKAATQHLPWGIKIRIDEGIQKIEQIALQFRYWFQRCFCEEVMNNCYTKTIWDKKLWDPNDEYFINNFLDSDLNFDDYKLAEKLVTDNRCDARIRFIVACYYCLTDYIVQNWHNYNVNEFKLRDRDVCMIKFWIDHMKNPFMANWESGFIKSAWSGEKRAVMYFCGKLTPDQISHYATNSSFILSVIRGANYTNRDFIYHLIPTKKQLTTTYKWHFDNVRRFKLPYLKLLLHPRCDSELYRNLLTIQYENNPYLCFSMLHMVCRDECFTNSPTTRRIYYDVVKCLWDNIKKNVQFLPGYMATNEILVSFIKYNKWDCFVYIVKNLGSNYKGQIMKTYVHDTCNIYFESEGIERSFVLLLQDFDDDDDGKVYFRDDALVCVNELLGMDWEFYTYKKKRRIHVKSIVIPILNRLKERIENCKGLKRDCSVLEDEKSKFKRVKIL